MTADVVSLMKGIQGQFDAKNKELADLKASCNKTSKDDARRIQDLQANVAAREKTIAGLQSWYKSGKRARQPMRLSCCHRG